MLKLNLKPLFQLYGEQFVNDIIARMNEPVDGKMINSTGAGARSLKYKAGPLGLQVEGADYLAYVDSGLDKYKGKKPPTAPLERWIEAKIAPNLDEFERKRMAFAISDTIAKKGTIKRFTYQGADFINFVINKNSQSLIDDIAQFSIEQIGEAIEAELKTYKDIEVR